MMEKKVQSFFSTEMSKDIYLVPYFVFQDSSASSQLAQHSAWAKEFHKRETDLTGLSEPGSLPLR